MDLRKELETLAMIGLVDIKYFESSQDEEYKIDDIVVLFTNAGYHFKTGSLPLLLDAIEELKSIHHMN